MTHLSHSTFVVRIALIVLAAAIGAFVVAPTHAYAVTAAEKQAEAEEALANLNAMQATLDELSAEYGEAVAAQEQAQANRDQAQARINAINDEISDLQSRLGGRARDMYRSGTLQYLDILLGSNSFEEFATSWDLLNKVNQSDADLIDEQRKLKAEAEEQRAIFEEQEREAAAWAEQAAEAERQAEATVAEMQAIYDSLSEEAAQLLEEERRAAEEAERARLAAEQAARQSEGGSSYSFDDEVVTAFEGGSDIVSRAYACLGAPYVWGAVGPYGYDCSGLVSYCYLGTHSRLGTTYTFMDYPEVSNPQPGDICTNWSHCGIYIGGGQMIHASTYGVGTIIGPVQSGMIIVRPSWA